MQTTTAKEASGSRTTPQSSPNAPACTYCGGQTAPCFNNCADRILDTPGRFDYSRCLSCHSLHVDPMPSAETLRLAYGGGYVTHAAPLSNFSGGASFKELLRNSILGSEYGYKHLTDPLPGWLKTTGKLCSHIGPLRSKAGSSVQFLKHRQNGKLLDVGCGNGTFLTTAQRLGWIGTGLEPDPVAAAVARKHGCRVIEDNIETFHPGEERFDAMTMNHVLEHVAEPGFVLNKLKMALADDGVLVTVTPNPASLTARIFGISWYGLDPPRHLHIPTAKGLSALCKQLGFDSVLLTLPRNSGRYTLESLSIRRSGKAHNRPARMIPQLLGTVERLLNSAGSQLGEELVCIATKVRQ